MNTLLFGVFPYVAVTLAVVVTLYRMRYRKFTVSALSSQLLEHRKLYFGSIPFHWGTVLVLLGHVLAVFFPKGILLWNAVPLRLYLLEGTGLALGLWALIGLVLLLERRFTEPRIAAVTTGMDILVLLLLLVSLITGVWIAIFHRFGSFWFPGMMTPYLQSLITLSPRVELLADLPFMVQLHVFNFFLLLAVMPFSRLIHIITLPLGYLGRPWQIVVPPSSR